MLEGGPKFAGMIGLNNHENNYYDMSQGFYHKLGEGTNMSVDSFASMPASNDGGSVAMSLDNSSVGSNTNDSHTRILNHQGLKRRDNDNYSVQHSVNRRGRVMHALSDDALARALMDSSFSTQGLENYEEWTIDLRKLNMGAAFAQGAFGKLYRGTYNGEDVAIKLLERPENDLERAQLMEQQFQQEVKMLATLKHPNIVRFIGACRKPMVWCIVTEYAKGGSVRQFLMKRQSRAVPLKLAVKQALDVARGMAYVHALGLIHRDLKSDNLLIFSTTSCSKGRLYTGVPTTSWRHICSLPALAWNGCRFVRLSIESSNCNLNITISKLCQVSGTEPDIIHVHEWQTAALPLLYWDMYHHLSLKKPRILLTIHNMEHYGECRQEQLSKCGLDGSIYATTDKAVDDRTIGHNPERLSLLKGGIVYSNAVVTVSPTYLKETLCSGWLSSILISNRQKYFGVLNGIDTAMWNPEFDVFLPAKFHAQNVKGKRLCKYYVQKGLGLATGDHGTDMTNKVPLVICITRLVAQKGLHLITHAIKRVEELGGQMIILGKAPDGNVQREFEGLANMHNQGHSIRILLMYSEELSHMLYAAADMVLVPSMYEPCGLSQMIGMRYGAVPVVRKTGGLADTVFDMDDRPNHDMANGFVFEGIDEASLDRALDRAFSNYIDKPDEWNSIVKKVMEIDSSWNNTAGKYIKIYDSIRARE